MSKEEAASIIAIVGILAYVRIETGRYMMEIVTEALPRLLG